MNIVWWAHPSFLKNKFRNWLKQHDIILKLILIIKHFKGEDVIQNVENDAEKDRLLHFFSGKTSVDFEKYEKRLEKYPKVVFVANDYKMLTMLVKKGKKQDQHAYLKKKQSS